MAMRGSLAVAQQRRAELLQKRRRRYGGGVRNGWITADDRR
eukprot:COSAG02_NODE_9032_length_2355_cov_1.647606_1_plen_41_part_00